MSHRRIVHLPFYDENRYQAALMEAQERAGLETIRGGGGGNFLRTALTRWRPDVLHFHWIHPYLLRDSSTATMLRSSRFLSEVGLLRAAGHKIVWTAHNLANHEKQHVRLERFFTRAFVQLVDAVVCHSEIGRSAVQEAFGIRDAGRVQVIPHGSCHGWYPNTTSRASARAEFGITDAETVYLFLGQLRPYKGLARLIQEFRRLDSKATRLLVTGRANNEQQVAELRARIAGDERILLHPGFVPDDRIQVYLNAADVVVLPYRDVLTSGAVVLAMSFGKPCIAPAIGDIPETLTADGGFLYAAEDAAGLAQAMRAALDAEGRLQEIGERNRARAEQWTWDDVAAAMCRVYELIDPRAASLRHAAQPFGKCQP